MDNATCDDVVMMEESPVSNCPVCCQALPLSQHELVGLCDILCFFLTPLFFQDLTNALNMLHTGGLHHHQPVTAFFPHT